MDEMVLEIKGANKFFPGVHALKDVNFSLKKGEVHAILGENGAGKSTLIKLIAGVHKIDSGEIYVYGEKRDINSVHDSEKLGIRCIYQELALAENMTVADNIFLGNEPKTKLGTVDSKKMKKEAQQIVNQLGTGIYASQKVSSLSIAQKQVVEIAKALSEESQIIVMDEPTALLSEDEVSKFFKTIETLKKQSIAIIYISHRMEEIFKISDRVTVLRDGEYIDTKNVQSTDEDTLIKLMVGRELLDYYNRDDTCTDEIVLEVHNFNNENLKDVSIEVKKGEIVGISGLVGAGRTELARAIFGVDKLSSGKLLLEGKEIKINKPADAIRNGIVLVPESRKDHGLVLIQSVMFNITICVLEKFIKFFRVNSKVENKITKQFIDKLSIKASSKNQLVINLSGGNQQKIVLSKWLAIKPKILILDEPTRGIDVGAKAEIYAIMNDLVKQGDGIIMISSELPEIINMCDKVYVMNHGEIRACFQKGEISQEKIISIAIGVDKK